MTSRIPAALIAAALATAILTGCSDSGPNTVGVIQSVNDDQTIGICDADGLRTYRLPDALGQANNAEIAAFAQSGDAFHFEFDASTDSEIYPTLSGLDFDQAGLEIPNACS